jgi:hypothetical protein
MSISWIYMTSGVKILEYEGMRYVEIQALYKTAGLLRECHICRVEADTLTSYYCKVLKAQGNGLVC